MDALTFDQYQEGAESTAIYPRMYTEAQIRQMAGYLSVAILELNSVHPETVLDAIEEAMDAVENPFNRMVYPVLGLAGEAGEIANKFKKVARDSGGEMFASDVRMFEDEVGDAQWYVSELASGLRSRLSSIASSNLNKLASRKERGVLQGGGDHR